MGNSSSKVNQFGQPIFQFDVAEFQFKMTTLDSYLNFQIENARFEGLASLEGKLLNDMRSPQRNQQSELILANSILHQYNRIQLLQSASQSCFQLLSNAQYIELLGVDFNKVPTEILLSLERLLYIVKHEQGTTLGQFGYGLRHQFVKLFGAKLLEHLEKFSRLATKENLTSYETLEYPKEEVKNFLLTFAKEKGIGQNNSMGGYPGGGYPGGGYPGGGMSFSSGYPNQFGQFPPQKQFNDPFQPNQFSQSQPQQNVVSMMMMGSGSPYGGYPQQLSQSHPTGYPQPSNQFGFPQQQQQTSLYPSFYPPPNQFQQPVQQQQQYPFQQQQQQYPFQQQQYPPQQQQGYPTLQQQYPSQQQQQQPQQSFQQQPLQQQKPLQQQQQPIQQQQQQPLQQKNDPFNTNPLQQKNDPFGGFNMATSVLVNPFKKPTHEEASPKDLKLILEEKYQEEFKAAPMKKEKNPIQDLIKHTSTLKIFNINPDFFLKKEEKKQDEIKKPNVSFLDNVHGIKEVDEDDFELLATDEALKGIMGLSIHNKTQPGFTQLFNQIKTDLDPKKMPMLASIAIRPSLKHFYDPNVINFLESTRNDLRKTGKSYMDKDFSPTSPSSLAYSPSTFMPDRKFIWCRLDANYNPKIKLFDNIKPDVLKQGALGDCYLLSGIAALAEVPEFLKRLIYPQELSKEGIYAVTLCDSGAWKTVVIDDYVPCYDYSKKPAFSSHMDGDNGIFIPLIEKAYAKIFKSYQAIVAGSPTLALNSLTGAPTDFFDLEDESFQNNPDKERVVWEYLQSTQSAGYLTVASSTEDNMARSQLPLAQKGIVKGHAYTVLSVCQIKTDAGRTEHLIKLRNPWGKMEWNGDWSDNSKLWTEYTKKQVGGLVKADDGAFFMSIRDFIKCYSDISTCKFYPKYHYSFIKIEHKHQLPPKNVSIVKFVVRRKMHAYVTVFQKERRHFEYKNQNYEFSFLRANLLKVNASNPSSLEVADYICGDFQAKHALTFDNVLEPGHYLLMVETFWAQNYYNDLVIGGYAEEELSFEDYSIHKPKYNQILAQMATKFVKGNLERKTMDGIREYEYKGAPGVRRFNTFKLDGLWFCYFENKSKNSWLEETFKLKIDRRDIAQVVFPQQYPDDLSFENKLAPGDETLILVKIMSGDALNISFSTSFRVRTKS